MIPVPKAQVAFRAGGRLACAPTSLFAAAVMYSLLPAQASLSFGAFAGIYLLAIAAGIVSNVPGGITACSRPCCCCS